MLHKLKLNATHYQLRGTQIVDEMNGSHPVLMVREYDNPHDKNAIGVWVKIGYVAKHQATEWAPQMDLMPAAATLDGTLVQHSWIQFDYDPVDIGVADTTPEE